MGADAVGPTGLRVIACSADGDDACGATDVVASSTVISSVALFFADDCVAGLRRPRPLRDDSPTSDPGPMVIWLSLALSRERAEALLTGAAATDEEEGEEAGIRRKESLPCVEGPRRPRVTDLEMERFVP